MFYLYKYFILVLSSKDQQNKRNNMRFVVMSKDNTGWFVVQAFGNMETAKQFLTMLRNEYPSYQYKISE